MKSDDSISLSQAIKKSECDGKAKSSNCVNKYRKINRYLCTQHPQVI